MTKEAFAQALSPHLFWDVDRDSIDPELHGQFLIPRIMDRGTRNDVREAWKYYGETRVREALQNAASLQKKTIAFFANQFNLSREQFRAWREQPRQWDP